MDNTDQANQEPHFPRQYLNTCLQIWQLLHILPPLVLGDEFNVPKIDVPIFKSYIMDWPILP